MQKPTSTLSKREAILGLVTLLVAVSAYMKYWYVGAQSSAKDLEQKIVSLQSTIATKKISSVEMEQKRKMASVDAKNADAHLADIMVNSQQVTQIVQSLTNAGNEIKTKLIELQETEETSDFKKLTFMVELEGTFPSISAFIEKFEASPLLAEISGIEVARKLPDLRKCSAKFTVVSYLFKEAAGD